MKTRTPIVFQTMAKPMSSVCNLDCTYCYYLEKEKLFGKGSAVRMNDATLEKFIVEYISAQDIDTVSFTWQGGEPSLMGVAFFEKVIALQQKHAGGKHIENALQTNGTLLNDEWCQFLRKQNFLVGISIDGTEHIHDHYRAYKNGRPSFADVMRGISLLQKHKVDFNTLTVVTDYSRQFGCEIYQFLKEIGSQFMQFIPVVERKRNTTLTDTLNLTTPDITEASLTDWSVNPMDFGCFLIDVFDEWVRHDVGEYFVQLFDVTLANWAGVNAGLCVFSEKCGNASIIESNGDIYSCDHYVYPEYKVGNIHQKNLKDIMLSDKQIAFGEHKSSTLPTQCVQCDYLFTCYGDCPKHRFVGTDDDDKKISYLCDGYQAYFRHVTPFMNFMINELRNSRPPANVMEWARKMQKTISFDDAKRHLKYEF